MADQLLTAALTSGDSVRCCNLSTFPPRIKAGNSFCAMGHGGIDAEQCVTKFLLVCNQSLFEHFSGTNNIRRRQEEPGSAHCFCCEDCASDLHRKLQAAPKRQLTEIKRRFPKSRDMLGCNDESLAVLVILDQLLRGFKTRSLVSCRKVLRENLKARTRERQFISKPKSDDCIEPACISPLPYQRGKQSNQYAGHRPHSSPGVPPYNAAAVPRRPACAYSIPPAHSLIPLWTDRHSAMPLRRAEISYG